MIEIEIEFDYSDVTARLDQFEALLNSNSDFHERVAGFLHSVVMDNFDNQRDRSTGKSWEPLSETRVRQRGSFGPILQDTGNLKNSITPFHDNNEASVSTQVGYAALMQFGGVNEEGFTVPGRPFMTMNEADVEHIEAMAEDHFFRPFA